MDGTSDTPVEIEVAKGLASVDPADWDACAAPETGTGGRAGHPFVTHAFLSAFEDSGSAAVETGWAPQHLLARHQGRLLGAMPLYLKGHSQGEYVFDHSWAHAFHRAGGQYYPKLQCAVPFTPAPGPRLLVRADAAPGREAVQRALLQGACALAERRGLSSLHVTFCTEEEWRLGGATGLLQRTDQQFHWENAGYESFDAFLAALASRKRKQLRKERARALSPGIRIHWLSGADIRPEHWDAFWAFYQDTGMRKWGRPYLTRAFFEMVQARCGDELLLVMAERDGRWIAGALNVIGRETLYGRYWGCVEEHPFLHFETCYYQAIDYAIAHGLSRVEAGAQGGHKLLRGYSPVTTHSLHWIAHPGLRDAVARYLAAEREAVAEESADLSEMTPYRRG